MIHLLAGATDTDKPMVLWDNVLARAVLSSTAVNAGGDVANALGPQTYDFWKPKPIYRVSGAATFNNLAWLNNNGVYKYSTMNARELKIAGMQLQLGASVADFQSVSDYSPVGSINRLRWSDPASTAQLSIFGGNYSFNAGSIGNFLQSIKIGPSGGGSYVYVAQSGLVVGDVGTISAHVSMIDGGAPVPGVDFALVAGGNVPGAYVIEPPSMTAVLPVAETVDALAVAAHELGSRGGKLRLSYSATDAGAWVQVGEMIPADNRAALLVFPAVTGKRFKIEVIGGGDVPLGIVSLGKRLVVPSSIRPAYVTADAAERVQVAGLRSLGGHFVSGSIQRRGVEMDAALNPVPASWAGADLAAFRRWYDRGGTFFWAGCPGVLPQDVAYVWRPDGAAELRPTLKAGGYWADLSLRMVGYA